MVYTLFHALLWYSGVWPWNEVHVISYFKTFKFVGVCSLVGKVFL